jgi:hypothetical protein
MVFGSLRDSKNATVDTSTIVAVTLASNEFVYPFQTLSTSIKSIESGSQNYLLGKSLFIYPITIFIPRVLFPCKPNSLGDDFVVKHVGKGGQGYAFSPVTEFYINFGLFAPFFFTFLISILFKYISDKEFAISNLLFLTLIPDFFRSEISGFIYQLFFYSFFFILIIILKNIIIHKNLKI